jgi:hypothetical protein
MAICGAGIAFADEPYSKRSCPRAELKHHPKILTTKIEDGNTGFCSFFATLPRDQQANALPVVQAAEFMQAALRAPTQKEFEELVGTKFGPALQNTFLGLLIDADLGSDFQALLKEESETLTACAKAALGKEQYVYAKRFELSCGIEENGVNFFFTAMHNGIALEVSLPRV